jgi:CopG-like RHH_1 or ribbon-helix-helix domain, RHH_5
MPKPEKLTVVLEPAARNELCEWAREEGRPLSNLLRRLVAKSLEDRRTARQEHAQ